MISEAHTSVYLVHMCFIEQSSTYCNIRLLSSKCDGTASSGPAAGCSLFCTSASVRLCATSDQKHRWCETSLQERGWICSTLYVPYTEVSKTTSLSLDMCRINILILKRQMRETQDHGACFDQGPGGLECFLGRVGGGRL